MDKVSGMIRYPSILISGPDGAGKSTLATALSSKLNLPVYLERIEDNPYFAPSVIEPRRGSRFLSQAIFLANAYLNHLEIGEDGGVQERGAQENFEVFVRYFRESGSLTFAEYSALEGMYRSMSRMIMRPALLVHVNAQPEHLLLSIQQRSTPGEETLDLEYLRGLERLYDQFLRSWTWSPVLRIDNSARFTDPSEVCDRILMALPDDIWADWKVVARELLGREAPGEAAFH